MGILDGVFAGENGVSAMLHKTLGGTAKVRIVGYTRDGATEILTPAYTEYEVPFVPGNADNSRAPLGASGASRSDVREPESLLSGTFPCAALDADVKPERDRIVYGGIEYQIESVEKLNVGDAPVQYSITARRV